MYYNNKVEECTRYISFFRRLSILEDRFEEYAMNCLGELGVFVAASISGALLGFGLLGLYMWLVQK